jgi:hypothetical protein
MEVDLKLASEIQIPKLKVADYMTNNPITIEYSAMFPEAALLWPPKEL